VRRENQNMREGSEMRRVERLLAALLGAGLLGVAGLAGAEQGDDPLVERGRYLAKIAGCNDCHTAGYPQADGLVPESEWLMGDRLGWRGGWGTTYAGNLRLLVDGMTEEQWVQLARNARYRPPMPWFVLRDMSDEDVIALYRFLRHLGPAGAPAPAWVPPDMEPEGPYVQWPAPPQ
jgi:mono/diheme cytochrome c family protein